MFNEEATIKKVTDSNDYYSILTDKSWGFGLSKEYGVTPKVGDRIKTDIIHWTEIRGVVLNDVRVFYKTDEQLEQERQEWLANNGRKKQEAFEKNKTQMDADYDALPENFRKRIDRFRANNERFRVDYEGYEVFCCQEALKIAAACGIPEKVEEFKKAKWEDQKSMVPALSEEHSGNTFGCATQLAYIHLKWPERIHEPHGALSSLVGSDEYGNVANKGEIA